MPCAPSHSLCFEVISKVSFGSGCISFLPLISLPLRCRAWVECSNVTFLPTMHLPYIQMNRYIAWMLILDRVDIWRDRRSCKILVSRVNFSEKNANCVEILPGNMIMVLLSTLMVLLPFNCVMFAQS